MKPLRIGLIGAGGIGAHHAARYGRVEGLEFTAVVDVDEERAGRLAKEHGVEHVFSSYEEAIRSGSFDAVDICLPTWLHAEVAVAAAEAGKHVLCEKPMATSLEEADAMVEAAQKAGVVLMIAQCRRYDNFWGTVRRALAEGAIGGPVVWRDVSGSQGPGPLWFYDRKKGLGPLVDGAIHNYDFARTMFGEPTTVYATGRSYKPVTAPDTGIAVVRFERGDELQLSWTWGLPSGVRAGGAMDVLGPEGVLFFSPPGHIKAPEIPEGHRQVVAVREGGEVVSYPYEPNDMYVDEMQAFVDAIAGKRDVDPDGVEGRKSLAIGMAVLDSAEGGGLITLA